MNQRIRELAGQAGWYITDDDEHSTLFGKFVERFAELIVRECIVDFYRNCLDITSNEDIVVQVERYVQEHFEVE